MLQTQVNLYMDDWLNPNRSKKRLDDRSGLLLDPGKVFFALKTFRIKLVYLLRAGRPDSEPPILRDNLNATKWSIISRGFNQLGQNDLPC